MSVLADHWAPWDMFPPRVVAFLQNCYVRPRDVTSWARLMAGPRRNAIISRGLFAGCKTGVVLKRCGLAGMPWIAWDNASPEIGVRSTDKFPPDPAHMAAVVNKFAPELVIALGNEAQRGLEQLDLTGCEVLVGPHPAARLNVRPDLEKIARKVEELYEDVIGSTSFRRGGKIRASR